MSVLVLIIIISLSGIYDKKPSVLKHYFGRYGAQAIELSMSQLARTAFDDN